MSEIQERVEALMQSLEKVQQASETARRKEAEAKIAFEKAQSRLGRLVFQREMEMYQRPDIQQAVDPVTGEPSKEWAKQLVRSLLEVDDEYLGWIGEHEEAKQQYEYAQIEHVNKTEKLGMLKAQARLLAVMLQYGSDSS